MAQVVDMFRITAALQHVRVVIKEMDPGVVSGDGWELWKSACEAELSLADLRDRLLARCVQRQRSNATEAA